MKITTQRTALFGPFVLDLRSGELRKFGTRVKMGEQAFQILRLLLETPGEMVTREELRAKLWADDTFVDFDHGLNSAVQRLRDCLSDSAGDPRWVETIPRRGYRFVGDVKWSDQGITSEVLPQFDNGNRSKSADADALSVARELSKERGRLCARNRIALPIVAVWGFMLLIAAIGIAAVLVGMDVRRVRSRLFSRAEKPSIHFLAVLPLENLAADPAQEYFADGMTDELITMLAKNPDLRVISRTSAMQYKKVHRALPDIARELGVDGILEGSVNRSENRVHVNLQLIYAPTDTHVWAEGYDRDLNGALSLPQEVAQTIAKEANAASVPAGPQRYVNPAAHDAYLQGRYLWFAGDYDECRKYFDKAIQLQPDYAPGWSGLSVTILAGASGTAPRREVIDKAEAAARRAVELDDSFAEGHHAMAALYLFGKWDWERAEAESRRSLELDPNFSEAHHLRSYILFAMNRQEEALQKQKRATEIDPFERPWALGRAYYRVRRYDAAIEEFRMRAHAGSAALWVHLYLSRVYGFKGMDNESAHELEEHTRIHRGEKAAAEIQRAYERGGRKAVLQLQLNELKKRSRHEYVSSFDLSEACAALEMRGEALQYLEDAYREHSMDLVFLQQEPVFDFLHSDERYRALVKKIGLRS
jgi:TolB-like protein/DNA-binding winged helix-turn-helix (wHTH) protein